MTYVGEACLRLRNAEAAIDLAFDSLKSHCLHRARRGIDYALDFESARALVRPEPGVLWVRVESDDLSICAGTKVLIATEIGGYTTDMPEEIDWIPASGEPFATIFAHEQSERSSC